MQRKGAMGRRRKEDGMHVAIDYVGRAVFALFQFLEACVFVEACVDYPSANPRKTGGPSAVRDARRQAMLAIKERFAATRIVNRSCGAAKRLSNPRAAGKHSHSQGRCVPSW